MVSFRFDHGVYAASTTRFSAVLWRTFVDSCGRLKSCVELIETLSL